MLQKISRSLSRCKILSALILGGAILLLNAEAFAFKLSSSELVKKQDYFSRLKPLKKDEVVLKLIEECSEGNNCLSLAERSYKDLVKIGFGGLVDDLVITYSLQNKKRLSEFSFLDLASLNQNLLVRLFKFYDEKDLKSVFGDLNFDHSKLDSYINKKPNLLCKLSFNPYFVNKSLKRLQKRLDFYNLNFSKFPCGLKMEGKFKELESELLKAKKGRAYKYDYSFKFLKNKIAKSVYSSSFKGKGAPKSSAKLWKRLLSYKPYIQKKVLRNLFYKRKYEDLAYIKQLPLKKVLSLDSKNLVYSIKSLIALGEYREVLRLTDHIKFKKSKWAEEILLMRASAFMRQNKYLESSWELEKLLGVSVDLRLSGLYWLWVSYTEIGKKLLAKQVSFKILKEYPFSYYGILVASKTIGPNFFNKYLLVKKIIREDFGAVLTQVEQNKLRVYHLSKRFKLFKKFYLSLEEKLTASQRALFALVFDNLGDKLQAIKILNVNWDQDQGLRINPFISTSFSKPYLPEVRKSLKGKNWMKEPVSFAVMRQESAFNAQAESPSGAKGLMQLLHSTAKDVARRSKLKTYKQSKQLFTPSVNIFLGTYYMDQLLRSSEGYLPYAFASYNAGLGKMHQWSKHRTEVTNLRKDFKNQETLPISELWIEELPWTETRFYAKALLRNIGIYLALSGRQKPFECRPFWHCLP